MMHDGWDHNNGGWIIGLLFMILLWGAVFWAIYMVVRSTHQTGPKQYAEPPARRSATEILEERLARGEIDVEDYERRRRALEAP